MRYLSLLLITLTQMNFPNNVSITGLQSKLSDNMYGINTAWLADREQKEHGGWRKASLISWIYNTFCNSKTGSSFATLISPKNWWKCMLAHLSEHIHSRVGSDNGSMPLFIFSEKKKRIQAMQNAMILNRCERWVSDITNVNLEVFSQNQFGWDSIFISSSGACPLFTIIFQKQQILVKYWYLTNNEWGNSFSFIG